MLFYASFRVEEYSTMRNNRLIISVINPIMAIGCLLMMSQCDPPFKPDYDSGFGVIIAKDTCQNQKVYLMNIDGLYPYKSGYSYKDSLRIGSKTYDRVVRLDLTRITQSSELNVSDKFIIDFTRGNRSTISNCIGLSNREIETINVISINRSTY